MSGAQQSHENRFQDPRSNRQQCSVRKKLGSVVCTFACAMVEFDRTRKDPVTVRGLTHDGRALWPGWMALLGLQGSIGHVLNR